MEENPSIKVTLVDDDPELCSLMSEFLEGEGFNVSTIQDSEQALLITENDCDAIVLDIMMPKVSGLEVLQSLRNRISTPIIMLTGRGDDIDRIIGLEMGADDYLGKPCNPRELAARLRAVLRRGRLHSEESTPAPQQLSLHGIELSLGQREARANERPLKLTSAEFNVLALLMQSAGEVISKDELTEKVLHRKLSPYDRSIDVHVSRVRQKLNKAIGDKELIKTARGMGYVMIQEQ